MRNYLLTPKSVVSALLILFVSGFVSAQSLELPQPSPASKSYQKVGYTDIEITYSSPGVKGRKIFGDLVPLDKVWRTGANKNTVVKFSKDVMIGDNELKAGEYSLFTIPGNEEWTIIFNTNTNLWGEGSYKEEEDALRVKAKSQAIPKRERLLIYVDNFNDSEGHLSIEWDTVKVSVPFSVHTDKQAEKAINKAIGSIGGIYLNAARYLQSNDKDLDRALEYANSAIENKSDHWYYYWIRANIHKQKGDVASAKKDLTTTKELGEKAVNSFYSFYKERVEKGLADW